MKRPVLGLVLFFFLAQWTAYAEQADLFLGGPLEDLPVGVASMQGAVVALGVNIGDASGNFYYQIKYAAGQTWYAYFTVVNLSSSSQPFKLEADFRYQDGAGYKTYRASGSLNARNYGVYRLAVTPTMAQLGIVTLTGRVHGAGMGNDNKVTSQVYIY